ncbi:MAG: hypothetical protein V2I41_01485 [Pseudomonadales bacterium]|jgi:hypothetical protein|nr:hypothetical protein [Pseudomonadales bacterium]
MGYRKLLKGYLAHVNDTIGSDLVELAAQKNAFKPRDLGELRSVAAELKREACEALERDRPIEIKAASANTRNSSGETPPHHN